MQQRASELKKESALILGLRRDLNSFVFRLWAMFFGATSPPLSEGFDDLVSKLGRLGLSRSSRNAKQQNDGSASRIPKDWCGSFSALARSQSGLSRIVTRSFEIGGSARPTSDKADPRVWWKGPPMVFPSQRHPPYAAHDPDPKARVR